MTYIKLNNIKIRYERYGSGEPLLLLHGMGACIEDWQPQIDFFKNYFEVIVFDFRGHGQSSKPAGPYTMEQFAQDAADLMQHLGFSQYHLMGLSLGGMLSFQIALMFPDRIRSLVVVNGLPEIKRNSLGIKLAIWSRLMAIQFLGLDYFGKKLSWRLFPKLEQAPLRQIMMQHWQYNEKAPYLATFQAILNWSVADRLHEINHPVLFMCADKDYLPVRAKQPYIEQLPNVELHVIEDSHHAVTAEKPKEVNEAALVFLQRHAING